MLTLAGLPAFPTAVIAATAASLMGRSCPAVLGGGGSAGPVLEVRSDLSTTQHLADPAAMLLVGTGQGVEHVVVVFSAQRRGKRTSPAGRDHVAHS